MLVKKTSPIELVWRYLSNRRLVKAKSRESLHFNSHVRLSDLSCGARWMRGTQQLCVWRRGLYTLTAFQ